MNKNKLTFNDIRPGSRVTILIPNGKSIERDKNGKSTGKIVQDWKEKTGTALIGSPAHAAVKTHWALTMGGRFGIPCVCEPENFVKIVKQ